MRVRVRLLQEGRNTELRSFDFPRRRRSSLQGGSPTCEGGYDGRARLLQLVHLCDGRTTAASVAGASCSGRYDPMALRQDDHHLDDLWRRSGPGFSALLSTDGRAALISGRRDT